MITRKKLETYLSELLNVEVFKDYAHNGLQIEGKSKITKISCATSASLPVIQNLKHKPTDALLVHHGFFWDNEKTRLINGYRKKIEILIKNNINLFAYHLPLDAHDKFGNNRPILELMNCNKIKKLADIGYLGTLKSPLEQEEYFQQLDSIYSRNGTHLSYIKRNHIKKIKKIAIVSGGGQSYLNHVIDYNNRTSQKKIDAFITGESSEWVYSLCLENKLCYSAMGHNKSEEIGVQLLGLHLAEKFDLEYEFIADKNPF